jgi:Sulfotransferase family
MTAGTKIVHLHIPKTAGTAIAKAFERAAGGSLRVFPHFEEKLYANIDPTQYDFFSGHFGFKTAATLGGKLITVLRDPIDRFVSVYYFWRQLLEDGREKSLKTQLASKYSLAEFVKIRDEPSLLVALHNTMTWQIAHGTSLASRRELRRLGKTEDDVYKLALANLSKFALVGIQERLELFEKAVERKFSMSVEIKRRNVTVARASVIDISAATKRAIHDWSLMDMELYQEAHKLAESSQKNGTS